MQVQGPLTVKRSSGVYRLRGGSNKEFEKETTDRARAGQVQEIERDHQCGLALNWEGTLQTCGGKERKEKPMNIDMFTEKLSETSLMTSIFSLM